MGRCRRYFALSRGSMGIVISGRLYSVCPVTGQETQYNNQKDDGYYQKGIAKS